MASLWGYQWVVYQLVTSHETLAKKFSSFPQALQFVQGVFKTKGYQQPLVSFIEIEHLGWLDVIIIMQDKGGEYGLEGHI